MSSRHALIVAVAKFDASNLGDLPGVTVNGERMKAFCEDPAKGAFDTVRLLKDASLVEIRAALADLFKP